MKVTVAQLNPVVGDVQGNLKRLREVVDTIAEGDTDLVVTPELYLPGYPPRDLLNLSWFVERLEEALEELRELSREREDLGILVGTVRPGARTAGKGLHNSAVLLEKGEILFEQHKQLLPTYDVFDELRYFDAAAAGDVVDYRGVKLGISICEDAWNDPDFENIMIYDHNPIAGLARKGAEAMINLSASPYHRGKEVNRLQRSAFHARKWSVPFLFAGQVGANDELIFDGYSHAVDSEGRALDWLPAFEEAVGTFNLDRRGGEEEFPRMEEMEGVRRALVLGLRDYLRKTGFEKAVLGLSGGIDSALTAAIAVDALGPENVQGVTMPSMHSSSGSVTDSQQLAMNLGIALDEIPIRPIYEQFMEALEPAFRGTEPGVAEENIQARIRGDLLMAYSNKFGSILLSTGNKSELAVGYSTLYGDMNGGLAVLSDLPKTTVYELARWYNREGEVIPEATITKPPSAELAPDQEDQDTLPPYDVLDPILELYIEEGKGIPQIVEQGYDEEVVRWVVHAVNGNEYKRKQMAPGLRVTTKAFGAGRRMPIAARFD